MPHADNAEARLLTEQFETVPFLATPSDLWSSGAELGRACRRRGFTIPSLDLLIAAVAIHHNAEVITFDNDFEQIAIVSALRVTRLKRPTS